MAGAGPGTQGTERPDAEERPPDARAERPREGRIWAQTAIPLASIALAIAIGGVVILLSGLATSGQLDLALPFVAYGALLQGAVGGVNEIVRTMVNSAPLLLAGLSVALGFKAGLFNIGATGQFLVGGFAAAVVGSWVAGQPAIIAVPLTVVAGALAGAAYGFIPGFLKATTGAHEVVTTIMLNAIAALAIAALVNGPLRAPGYTFGRTADLGNAALPVIFGRDLHLGVLLAVAFVPIMHWLVRRTTLGFEIRTVGANASAARYAGMSPRRIIILTMSLGGMLAGLAGVIYIVGQVGFYPATFGTGIGFDAITVALLGRGNPLGVLLAALLFGGMRAGAPLMQIRADIPIEIVDVLQAIILFFLAADILVRRIFRVRGAKEGMADLQAVTRSYGEGAVR